MIRPLSVAAAALLSGCWVAHVPCSSDLDGDGYTSCKQPRGALPNGDCDDLDALINPGAEEIEGNCIDEDCDDALAPSAELEPFLTRSNGEPGGAMLCARAEAEASPQLGLALASAQPQDEPALVVGAPRRDRSGVVYFVGRDELLKAAGSVVAIEDVRQYQIQGDENSEMGSALALMDVTGGSEDELFVGAPAQSLEGTGARGAIFMLSATDWMEGSSLAFESNTDCPIPGAFCMVGDDTSRGSRLGTALVPGVDDAGEAFLLSSAPGYGTTDNEAALGAVVLVQDFSGRQTLGNRDTFALYGWERGAGFGAALATGDLDADGQPEAIVSANGVAAESGLSAGAIYSVAINGEDWTNSTADLAPLATGGDGITGLGTVLAGGFDINGDDRDDVVASTSCPPGDQSGCEYHVFVLLSADDGSDTGSLEVGIDVSWLDESDGPIRPATLRLDQREGQFTTLFVGGPSYEGGAGALWVLSGLENRIGGAVDLAVQGEPLSLASAEDGGGFAGAQLGSSLTRAWWDPLKDPGVALGAPRWSNDSGAVVWFSGDSVF